MTVSGAGYPAPDTNPKLISRPKSKGNSRTERAGRYSPAVREAGSAAVPSQKQVRLLPAEGPAGRISEALLLVHGQSVRLSRTFISLVSDVKASLDPVPWTPKAKWVGQGEVERAPKTRTSLRNPLQRGDRPIHALQIPNSNQKAPCPEQ